jgi:hypothetical protein
MSKLNTLDEDSDISVETEKMIKRLRTYLGIIFSVNIFGNSVVIWLFYYAPIYLLSMLIYPVFIVLIVRGLKRSLKL